jgi:hypothetical protein
MVNAINRVDWTKRSQQHMKKVHDDISEDSVKMLLKL